MDSMWQYVRYADGEDKAEQEFLFCLQLKMPYNRDRHQKDPHIGNHVCNVGKVSELDKVETVSFDSHVPEGFDRPASQCQRNGDTNTPGDDESCSGEYNPAEQRYNEDAMVKCQDTEFHKDQSAIIKMTEDVIAFPDHSLIVWRDNIYMSSHSVGRAYKCQPLDESGV